MTECERILSEGKFPQDFLNEEVRCGFKVTRRMKEIWLISIDLLMQLDTVCRKHGLTYYMTAGSLLGAIRHHGFIPWDDDLDIAIPRSDYEKLIELADEFKKPYFLQTQKSDPEYFYSFIKLRNSRTTAIKSYLRDTPFNKGMAIDLFPLDQVVLEGFEERYHKISRLCIDQSNYMRTFLKNPTSAEKKRIDAWSGRDPIEQAKEIEELITFGNDKETDYVGTTAITVYAPGTQVFKKTDHTEVEWIDFEEVMKVPVPVGWDAVLTTNFGDWRQMPPIEKRGTWHNTTIFDPDTPYDRYVVKESDII